MSKAELWREAKDLGIKFEIPWTKITRAQIQEAIDRFEKDAEEQAISARDGAALSIPTSVEETVEQPISAGDGAEVEQHVKPTLEEDEVLSSLATVDVKPNGKFRCAARRFMLTYKTHIPKDLVKEFFMQKRNADECIIAHEKGDNKLTPYEHSHVYVDFGKIFQSTNARIFDIKNGNEKIHPNIKVVATKSHLDNVWAYLCKEDESNLHLLERIAKKTLFETISAKPNIQEALKLAKTASEASGIVTMFNLKQKETLQAEELKEPWQLELIAELKERPDKRKIIWIYDSVGNTGKSDLARYAMVTKLAVTFTALGGDRDAGQLIATAEANGWDGRAVIIDLPRDAEHRSIYSPIEAIKNGLVTNTKYQGGTTITQRPHVVVMANFLPQVSRLSFDRWDIRELVSQVENHERVIIARRLNVHKVAEKAKACETTKEGAERILDRIKSLAYDRKSYFRRMMELARDELDAIASEEAYKAGIFPSE